MNAAQRLVQFLEAQGVDTLLGTQVGPSYHFMTHCTVLPFVTFWYGTNKPLRLRQTPTPAPPIVLGYALLPPGQVLPIW